MADIVNKIEQVKEVAKDLTLPILDRTLEQHVGHVETLLENKDEIAKLTLDKAALETLKDSKDHIMVVEEQGFLSNRKRVMMNMSSDKVKDLIGTYTSDRIDKLETEVKDGERKNDSLRYTNRELREERAVLTAKCCDHATDLKVAKASICKDYDLEIYNMKLRFKSELAETKLELKTYKAQYADSLNELRINIKSVGKALTTLTGKLKNSWLFKKFGKKYAEIREELIQLKIESGDLIKV